MYLIRQLIVLLKLTAGIFWGQSPELRAFLHLPAYGAPTPARAQLDAADAPAGSGPRARAGPVAGAARPPRRGARPRPSPRPRPRDRQRGGRIEASRQARSRSRRSGRRASTSRPISWWWAAARRARRRRWCWRARGTGWSSSRPGRGAPPADYPFTTYGAMRDLFADWGSLVTQSRALWPGGPGLVRGRHHRHQQRHRGPHPWRLLRPLGARVRHRRRRAGPSSLVPPGPHRARALGRGRPPRRPGAPQHPGHGRRPGPRHDLSLHGPLREGLRGAPPASASRGATQPAQAEHQPQQLRARGAQERGGRACSRRRPSTTWSSTGPGPWASPGASAIR